MAKLFCTEASWTLVRDGDAVYLPVRVSTGITTFGLTQITAGVDEKREILVLDDAHLHGTQRHKQEADLEALRRQARGLSAEEPDSQRRGPAPTKKPGKHAEVIDTTDYGEDPYAEPQ